MPRQETVSEQSLQSRSRWILIGTTIALLGVMAVLFYRASNSYVINQAENRIRDVMLESRALHWYVQRNMHPAMYKLKDEQRLPAGFYSPEMLSSTYIARNLYGYYDAERQKAGLPEIRYKLASANPRNPVNKANDYERSLIEMFSSDHSVSEHREIIEIDGQKHLLYATPFLAIEERCLKCHGDPEDAPPELREYYNWTGGYNYKVGDIVAMESIRTPLTAEFHTAQIMLAGFMGVAVIFAALFFVNGKLRNLVQRHTVALRSSEAQKRALLDGSPDMIMLLDKDLRIEWANAAALRINPEAVGAACHKVFTGQQEPCDNCPAKRAMTTGQIEMGVVQHDSILGVEGETFWEDIGVPLKDGDGKVTNVIAINRNVTARIHTEQARTQLECQLRQSQKMEAVGQLAGGVAHDFNNILTAILGNLELSQDELKVLLGGQHPLLDDLSEIEQSALRAARLTRQLLAFSRREIAQPKVISINEILDEMSKMLRRLLNENIILNLKLGEDLPQIRIDVSLLEQVVMNLVVNARDAMPEGGAVVLESSRILLDAEYCNIHREVSPGEYVQLCISDTGCGMEPQVVERVFEPFFTTKEVGEGTGLGLSTAYGIVKQAGGHITADSKPGQGTTFRVYIPAIGGGAEDEQQNTEGESTVNGAETVLICEDDDSVRSLTVQMLRNAGYNTAEAIDGSTAISVLEHTDNLIDLLITDVIMPDMNGQQLTEVLREKHPHLRTLYISGYTANVIAQHGVLEEGIEFLEKPYTRDDLLIRVRKILDTPVNSPAAD